MTSLQPQDASVTFIPRKTYPLYQFNALRYIHGSPERAPVSDAVLPNVVRSACQSVIMRDPGLSDILPGGERAILASYGATASVVPAYSLCYGYSVVLPDGQYLSSALERERCAHKLVVVARCPCPRCSSAALLLRLSLSSLASSAAVRRSGMVSNVKGDVAWGRFCQLCTGSFNAFPTVADFDKCKEFAHAVRSTYHAHRLLSQGPGPVRLEHTNGSVHRMQSLYCEGLKLTYEQYIHGSQPTSHYLALDPAFKNPADTTETHGLRMTIDSTATWNSNMER